MIKTLSLNFDRDPAIAGTVVWSETARVDHRVADAGAGAVTTLRTGGVVGVATDLLADPEARLPDRHRRWRLGPRPGPRRSRGPAGAPPDGGRRNQQRAEHSSTARTRTRRRRNAYLTDAETAVQDSEIVCCATTATRPLFAASALPAKVHVNAIGAFRPTMWELPDDLLANSSVVVDELDTVLEESDEIIYSLNARAIAKDSLTELGHALTADQAEYGKRAVFKTVGVAIQDCAIARLLAGKFLP